MPSKQFNKLPKGINLYRKIGVDLVDDLDQLTFIPGKDGFEMIEQHDQPGADAQAAFFDTEIEAITFKNGFECAGPGDDVAYVTESINLKDRKVFAFLAANFDSDGDCMGVSNYTKARRKRESK